MSGGPATGSVPVWDRFVRIAHWSLVLTVAAAWVTQEGAGRVHEWLGYAVLAIAAARILWGVAGSRYARFGQFVRGPAHTLHYAGSVAARTERRYVGHNPLGGYSIVLLLALILLVCGTGWLYTTDTYWGVEWVEELHEGLSNALLALVALHVTGVVYSSARHRENLVASMVHGRKRAPGPGDVH